MMMNNKLLIPFLLFVTACSNIDASLSSTISSSSNQLTTSETMNDIPLDGYIIRINKTATTTSGLKEVVKQFVEHNGYLYTLNVDYFDNVINSIYVIDCYKNTQTDLLLSIGALYLHLELYDNVTIYVSCNICHTDNIVLKKETDKEYVILEDDIYGKQQKKGKIQLSSPVDGFDELINNAKIIV